eukprot:jgi/Tetstr1/433526/TSEL_002399.t1
MSATAAALAFCRHMTCPGSLSSHENGASRSPCLPPPAAPAQPEPALFPPTAAWAGPTTVLGPRNRGPFLRLHPRLGTGAGIVHGWRLGSLAPARAATAAEEQCELDTVTSLLPFCMAWALYVNSSIYWLASGMALLGLYKGVFNPPMEAIFADSLESGPRRSEAYTKRYILAELRQLPGP